MEDETQELTYKVITTENGQQIPVQLSSGVSVEIFFHDDKTISEVKLDVTPEEFKDIQKLAVTNDIPADILSANGADTPQ